MNTFENWLIGVTHEIKIVCRYTLILILTQ